MINLLSLLPHVRDWFTAHQLELLVAGTMLAVGALVVVLVTAARHDRLADVATWVSVAIATAFSAEGMWEVATEALELDTWLALGLFAVAEAAMTSEAIRARRRYKATGNPGSHGVAVWCIAIAAGFVAALNAANIVEALVRLFIPTLAAALWWLEMTADRGTRKDSDAVTWRITPRRILVRFGVIEPGDRDVTQVHRDYQLAVLTSATDRLHEGAKSLRPLRRRRVRRLVLAADDNTVKEVIARLNRAREYEQKTAPKDTRAADSGKDTRPDTRPDGCPHPGPDASTDVRTDAGRITVAAPVRTSVRTSPEDLRSQIVRLLKTRPDLSQKQMADLLGVTDRTIRRHLAKVNGAEHR